MPDLKVARPEIDGRLASRYLACRVIGELLRYQLWQARQTRAARRAGTPGRHLVESLPLLAQQYERSADLAEAADTRLFRLVGVTCALRRARARLDALMRLPGGPARGAERQHARATFAVTNTSLARIWDALSRRREQALQAGQDPSFRQICQLMAEVFGARMTLGALQGRLIPVKSRPAPELSEPLVREVERQHAGGRRGAALLTVTRACGYAARRLSRERLARRLVRRGTCGPSRHRVQRRACRAHGARAPGGGEDGDGDGSDGPADASSPQRALQQPWLSLPACSLWPPRPITCHAGRARSSPGSALSIRWIHGGTVRRPPEGVAPSAPSPHGSTADQFPPDSPVDAGARRAASPVGPAVRTRPE